MQRDTPNKFSPKTLALHWIVGLMMIALLAIGVFMVETKAYALYPWHKSFGFIIFFIVLIRVFWRVTNGWPTPAGKYSQIEHLLAKVVHWALILGTVFMPISGAIMSTMGGHGLMVFGMEIVAMNPDPADPSKVLPHNAAIASFAHACHSWLGYLVIAAVVLHIVGALKHHIIDKDGTLKRIFGAKI
ncbi:cytochrome b [Corallincola spongiicola]|uniref:Cytochrome b n=1 Tax=Corallincola spongiicola TaxID=2520508 RepID=A0ABY1WQY9_9GAMM|nr:cytochrome b [Corallincola spongiicola]TAA47127.1 cytochrome b [Corallincola spongiicola]